MHVNESVLAIFRTISSKKNESILCYSDCKQSNIFSSKSVFFERIAMLSLHSPQFWEIAETACKNFFPIFAQWSKRPKLRKIAKQKEGKRNVVNLKKKNETILERLNKKNLFFYFFNTIIVRIKKKFRGLNKRI